MNTIILWLTNYFLHLGESTLIGTSNKGMYQKDVRYLKKRRSEQ